ncbi:MAG: ParB/RepB/Spo0J family partition protein [Verrucomicrobia bacterium]|nr:ParB/RepB/Spo0J family partition protein [Verrucomicrobiota bacterium]
MSKPAALGRGLSALLGGSPPMGNPVTVPVFSISPAATAVVPAAPVDNRERVLRVPLARIHPCAFQPRKDFSPDAIAELAASIREQGIVQPLIVRERDGEYELIAGERRWRAAQLLQLAEAPVILREASDREVLELALIENLQRENLNPIEEALGYGQLVGQFELTQDEVAKKVGKSRAVVANALRLLKLPAEVQGYLRDARLSVGHAKVILGLNSDDQTLLAARRILKDALNVRQTETLVAHLLQRGTTISSNRGKAGGPVAKDIHVTDVENKLTERFGTKVSLRYRAGKGAVEIKFFSDDELERILQIAGVKMD